MEQEEEKTILVLEEDNQSIQNTEHLSQDDFKVVLKDVCDKYTIITSIKNFTYRVELFIDNVLEDAVEVICDALKMDSEREIVFKSNYLKTHQEYKKKFCQKDNIETKSEVFISLEDKYQFKKENKKYQFIQTIWKRVAKIYRKTKENIQVRGYNHRMVLVGVLLGIIGFVVVIGRILMCNQNIIKIFVKQSDRIAYYKQTESFCHQLETGCLKLSKMDLQQDTLLSPDECRTWCKEKVISVDKCALFLPYFPTKKIAEPLGNEFKEEKKKKVQKVEVKNKYSFFPVKKIILKPKNYFELFIINNTNQILNVKLQNLVLNENEYEEIVQFSEGVTALSIAPKSKKSFKIFLEQTYYEQFKKGNYTGKFIFSIFLAKGKEEKVEKIFFFKVE